MSQSPIALIGAGAVTSLGASLTTTMPALRAELDNFQDTHFLDGHNEPVIGAKIPSLDNAYYESSDDSQDTDEDQNDKVVGGLATQFNWACLAIEEALSYIDLNNYQEYCLMLVSPSENQPNLIDYESLYQQIVEHCQTFIHEERLYHIHLPFGETATATAINKSQQWLYEDGCPKRVVILVGSDSWLNIKRVESGLKNKRILCDLQAEGFIPGEAASAVIFTQQSQSEYAALSIINATIDQEDRSLVSGRNSLADGLTKATQSALDASGIKAEDINLLLTDLGGEEYFFTESILSWARILRVDMTGQYEKHFTNTYTGHLGTVNGVFLLAYAWALQIKGQHPGLNTLIQLTSEDTQRAAITAQTN